MRIQNVDHKSFHGGIVKGKKLIMKKKSSSNNILLYNVKYPYIDNLCAKESSLESPAKYWELNFGQPVVEGSRVVWDVGQYAQGEKELLLWRMS